MAKPKGPISAKTIAEEKGYDEEQTTRLLNTLVGLKLVERITYNGTGMSHACIFDLRNVSVTIRK